MGNEREMNERDANGFRMGNRIRAPSVQLLTLVARLHGLPMKRYQIAQRNVTLAACRFVYVSLLLVATERHLKAIKEAH